MALNLLDLLLQSGETATFVTKMNTLFQRLTTYSTEREVKDATVDTQAQQAAASAHAAAQDAVAANTFKQQSESAALAAKNSATLAAKADGVLTQVQNLANSADTSAKNAATSASDAAKANQIALENAQVAVDAAGAALAAQKQVSGSIGTAAQQAAAAAKALLEQDMAGYIQQAQTARAGAEQAASLAAEQASTAASVRLDAFDAAVDQSLASVSAVVNTAQQNITQSVSVASNARAEAQEIAAGIEQKLNSVNSGKLRSAFLKRAQQVLSSDALWEFTGTALKFSSVTSSGSSIILVMGAGEGSASLNTGFLNIYPPAPATIVKGLGIADRQVDTNGFIPLGVHETLYYQLPAAGASWSDVGTWYCAYYAAGDYDVPEDFVFIAKGLYDLVAGTQVQLYDGRILAQGRNYPDTNWIPLAPYYNNGTGDFNRGYQVPRMRRLNNRVYLEGLLNAPSVGFVGALATLPAGCRPNARHIFNAAVQSSSARVDVESSGAVLSVTNAGVLSWISLDGINFGLE